MGPRASEAVPCGKTGRRVRKLGPVSRLAEARFCFCFSRAAQLVFLARVKDRGLSGKAGRQDHIWDPASRVAVVAARTAICLQSRVFGLPYLSGSAHPSLLSLFCLEPDRSCSLTPGLPCTYIAAPLLSSQRLVLQRPERALAGRGCVYWQLGRNSTPHF